MAAPDDVPSDWAAVWQLMLRARAGQSADGLIYGATTGWQLSHTVSARSAALFALYKPLLDARARLRTDPQAPAWVVGQLGQSLDGFIATSTGDSFFVNGEHCLLHLHRLRALSDAVLVGAGTVATDNPQLTTRHVPGPHAVRVVLDPEARLDPSRSLIFQDGHAPTLWVCDAAFVQVASDRLRLVTMHPVCTIAPGSAQTPLATCEVMGVEGLLQNDKAAPDLPERVVQALALRGLRLLFVEGGGVTVSRFFAAQALDRLHLAVAPVLIGQGRRGLQAPAHAVMADCLRPATRTLPLGNDILWDMDLRPISP